MRNNAIRFLAAAAVFCSSTAIVRAQAPNSSAGGSTGRTIQAIGYPVGGGGTKIDMINTGLIPHVSGEARVEAKPGVTTVEVKVKDVRPPMELGAEFLTYVLWAVSPEGRAINL